MTFTELVAKIALERNLSKVMVHEILKNYEDIVTLTVMGGEKVKSSGFGTFYPIKLASRKTPKGGMSAPRTTVRFRKSRS